MRFTKRSPGYVLATLTLAMGISTTQAAPLLQISGGTDLTIPTNNDVLYPQGGMSKSRSILSTTSNKIRLEFFFWGSESGYRNTLHADIYSHTEADNVNPGAEPVLFPGLGTPEFSYVQATAGDVGLYFISSGFSGSLNPGDDDALKSIAFAYLNASGDIVDKPTNIVLFTLDDSGAGPDDDHDDYVGFIRATAVPIPAAAWLFGSALLGLVGIARRRSPPG